MKHQGKIQDISLPTRQIGPRRVGEDDVDRRLISLSSRRMVVKRAIIFISLVIFTLPCYTWAQITGPCVFCHTMHASQSPWPDEWGDKAELPQPHLIAITGSDYCKACHTNSSDGNTIKLLGGTIRIPVVYNSSVAPDKPLAGGNFYWMVHNDDDTLGHNVWDISSPDANLNEAPGIAGIAPGCLVGCHVSLATDPVDSPLDKNGCQGCHVYPSHHGKNAPYRFLTGHVGPNYYAEGIEDPDWEQNPTQTNHNWYKGTTERYLTGAGLSNHSVSAFCAGCHGDFHDDMGGESGSSWLRHPSDVLLPMDGEYGDYDPITTYSNDAPVAYLDPGSPDRDSAVVMCLSCHRPHGSPYPDMLRWDYAEQKAGGGGATGTGCFRCHTQKDD